ncbi:MAG: hypothetical protein KDA77_21505, partial [Planctomycetaceae bacterium]|nr:hypothetical protein [Planctomycetaceae bacterium]
VIKETETHIWIAGKPVHKKHASCFSEFKLYLEKRPWRLKAVQYIHPGGNQSTVYLYSNIELNPLEWDEPDLTRYRSLSDRPVVSSKPVVIRLPLVARKPVNESSLSAVLSAICTGLGFVFSVF